MRRRVPNRSPRVRLALGIGPDELVGLRIESRWGRWHVGKAVRLTSSEPGWDWLGPAIADVRDRLEVPEDAEADVALLRPLCFAKVLRLPPVRRAALGQLLKVGAARHFPVGLELVAVCAVPVGGRKRGTLRPVLGVCAREFDLRRITAEIQGAGLRIGRIAPGPTAAVFGLRRLLRPLAGAEPVAVVFLSETRGEIVLFARGQPTAFIPVPLFSGELEPNLAESAARLLALAGERGREHRVVIVASADDDLALQAALEARGLTGESQAESLRRSPAVLATLGAAFQPETAPQLIPAGLKQSRDRRNRRQAIAFGVAAAVILVLAGLVHVAGVRREIHATQEARAAIEPAVSRALEANRAATELRNLLGTLRAAERQRVSWIAVLQEFTRALPDSAYLTALDGSIGELHVRGHGASAGTEAALGQPAEFAVTGTRPSGVVPEEGTFDLIVRFGAAGATARLPESEEAAQ